MLHRFVQKLQTMAQKYKSPKFWIMLEKEFKDDKDKLVSSVCKYDSSTGNLNYCGTICLQVKTWINNSLKVLDNLLQIFR